MGMLFSNILPKTVMDITQNGNFRESQKGKRGVRGLKVQISSLSGPSK